METHHKIGLGALAMLAAIAAILLFGPPWVRGSVGPLAGAPNSLGAPLGERFAQAVLGPDETPYVERRSECELLNAGYGLPLCDSYGPGFALYRQDIGPRFARLGMAPDYGVDPYSRGYGVEGRGWQLP